MPWSHSSAKTFGTGARANLLNSLKAYIFSLGNLSNIRGEAESLDENVQ